ncbi:unnamed protein product [Closterium sp. Naga37s-1]|nr:unnamed protein product [Closterium sp. Naga37s-1]
MASQAIVAMRICAPPALAPYMGARWRKAPNTPQFSTAFVVPMRTKRVTLSFRRNCRRPISAIFRAQRAGETRPGARSWMERMAKAAEEMARGAERASKEMAKVAAATLENHSKAIEAASPLLSQIVGGNEKATNFIANLIVPHAPGASASGSSATSPRSAAPQQLAEDHLREVSDDVVAHVSIKPANVAPMTSSFTSPSLGDDDSAAAAAANADPTSVPLEMRKAGAHVLEGREERGAMRAELQALEARMDAASAAVEAAKSRRGELLQAHPELRQRVTDVVEGKVIPRACSHPPPPPFPRSPHFPPFSPIPPRSPQLRQRVTDVVEGKVTPRAVTVTPTAVAPSSPSNAPSNAPGNSDAEGEAQEEWEEAEEEQAQAQGGAHGAAQQGVVAGSVQALRAGRHRQRERLQRPGVERRRQHAAQVGVGSGEWTRGMVNGGRGKAGRATDMVRLSHDMMTWCVCLCCARWQSVTVCWRRAHSRAQSRRQLFPISPLIIHFPIPIHFVCPARPRQVRLSVLRSLAERHGVLAQSTAAQATTGQAVTAQESEPVQVAREEPQQQQPHQPVVDTAALSPVELELQQQPLPLLPVVVTAALSPVELELVRAPAMGSLLPPLPCALPSPALPCPALPCRASPAACGGHGSTLSCRAGTGQGGGVMGQVKAEESWDKYLEAVAWTKARLNSLRSSAPSPSAAALLSMEAQLVSSLAFAQQRADEEAARVAQLCARVGADAGERRRSREEGLRRAAEAGAKMGKGAEGGPGNGERGEREGDEGKRVVSGGSSGGSLAGIGDMMSKVRCTRDADARVNGCFPSPSAPSICPFHLPLPLPLHFSNRVFTTHSPTPSSLPLPQLANIQHTLESMAASPPSLALKAALPSLSPVSPSSASAPSLSPISSSSSSPSLSPSSSPSSAVASLSSSSHTLSAFLASLKSPRSSPQQQHGVDGLVRELVLHGASEDWARGYIAEALLRPNVAAPKPLAVAIASGPPSPRASASHHECSQHELQQYAQAIRSAYVDASMSASEREVGTSLFVEELVAMGGKEVEQWARSFVAQSLATEVRKRKVVRA